MPITQAWYAIDTCDVATMNGTVKRFTADVYAVVKDDAKVSLDAPPVC